MKIILFISNKSKREFQNLFYIKIFGGSDPEAGSLPQKVREEAGAAMRTPRSALLTAQHVEESLENCQTQTPGSLLQRFCLGRSEVGLNDLHF